MLKSRLKEETRQCTLIFLLTFYLLGGVGRWITAFTTLLWLNLEHGFNVFIPKSTKESLSKIFVGQIESMRTLEDSLCDYKEFGFRTQLVPLDKIDTEDYNVGKALALKISPYQPGKGWWDLFQKYEKETKEALTSNSGISKYVETTMTEISRKVILIN